MAWDWKPGAYRDYTSARENLAKEQSERNFKEMIRVCQPIIEYHWIEAKVMDEYADLVQIYEKTVVAFWKKYNTLESLYHIVYFYCDWTFTLFIYGLREQNRLLEHMKKGIMYSQLYHKKVNRDYSAVLSIRLYRTLYEIRPGEGLLALEDAVRKFADFDAPICDFLPDYIMALVDGAEIDLLAEMMANEFEVRKPDDFEALVLYLYILAILIVQIEYQCGQILDREQALVAWSRIRNECLSYLPDECRGVLQIYI